jgi:hypothetical protein
MVEIEDPVLIEATAPAGHVEAVEAVLKRNGLDARVEAGIERRAVGDLPWLTRIVEEGTIYELLKFVATGGTTGSKRCTANFVTPATARATGKAPSSLSILRTLT